MGVSRVWSRIGLIFLGLSADAHFPSRQSSFRSSHLLGQNVSSPIKSTTCVGKNCHDCSVSAQLTPATSKPLMSFASRFTPDTSAPLVSAGSWSDLDSTVTWLCCGRPGVFFLLPSQIFSHPSDGSFLKWTAGASKLP